MSTHAEKVKTEAGASGKTGAIALIGVMAAVTCILGPLSIPIGPVPISLTNLAIYFTVCILGMKYGTISYCIYLLLGLIGLPVFASFTAGPAKLFGPTGGYLIGFIFLALISGAFFDRWLKNLPLCFLGMMLGTIVCYAFGTAWLAHLTGMSFGAALAAGVLPFIPGDLLKMVLALFFGPQLRKRLRAAGLVK